jgi:glycosyltransferase involved in cell wall biosynthesis
VSTRHANVRRPPDAILPVTKRTVLHLIDTPGPGGAETVYLNLVLGLDRARFRSVVTTDIPAPGAPQGEGISARGWLHDALRAHSIDPVVVHTTRAFDLAYLARLVRLVRTTRADVIHAHLLTSSVYGSAAGLLTGVPVVATFHGTVDIPSRRRLTGLKLAIINRGADRIVFVSDHLRREMLAATSLDGVRSVVVHNGVDDDRFRPAPNDRLRRSLGLGRDVLLVGSAGNVRRPKGYDVLLESAALASSRSPRMCFVVAGENTGDPALFQALLSQRSRLGLQDTVRFIGYQHAAADFLNGIDVFVLPSRQEGFSLSTIEAMACGLPVIATRSGGPEEIVTDGESGLLVPPGEAQPLASALERLRDDASLRSSLAARARTHVMEMFSIGSMVRGYEAIYDALC